MQKEYTPDAVQIQYPKRPTSIGDIELSAMLSLGNVKICV